MLNHMGTKLIESKQQHRFSFNTMLNHMGTKQGLLNVFILFSFNTMLNHMGTKPRIVYFLNNAMVLSISKSLKISKLSDN